MADSIRVIGDGPLINWKPPKGFEQAGEPKLVVCHLPDDYWVWDVPVREVSIEATPTRGY